MTTTDVPRNDPVTLEAVTPVGTTALHPSAIPCLSSKNSRKIQRLREGTRG